MPLPKVITAQRDFSAGQVNIEIKRSDDHPFLKAGARQMSNWRIQHRGITNRPGRRVLFLDGPRCDEVFMQENNLFRLIFLDQRLKVRNAAGTVVYDSGAGALPWQDSSVDQIVWDVLFNSIYFCFPGMQPRVLTWDGISQTSAWTLALYTEKLYGNQKRTPFYRISPRSVAMQATTATNTPLFFSAGMNLVAGHVGTRVRYAGRQLIITQVTSPTACNAAAQEPLFPSQQLGSGFGDPTAYFTVGDEVIGRTSGAKGIVLSTATGVPGTGNMTVQLITPTIFQANEIVTGPANSLLFDQPPPTFVQTGLITIWDDEVMNSLRLWPRSCFVDQSRLGFCDFPSVPGLIVWSAFGDPTDLYTDENNAGPLNAIQEIVPDRVRVLYVVPGVEGNEYVFTDRGVYYVPISSDNPLQPGSVSFRKVTEGGCAEIKPERAEQSIVYVAAGGKQIKALQAPGATQRPFIADDLSDLRSDLLTGPVAIAIPDGSDQFEERYLYVLNDDDTIVVGRYESKQGMIDPQSMGWLPWSSGVGANVTWISARNGAVVLFSSVYQLGSAPAVQLVEQLDADQYLDAALLYNSVPAAMAAPPGKGPLWWMPGGTVDLMDGASGTRMMGTYLIDADGFLIPQGNASEDFTSVNLRAGQMWSAIFEPFVPPVQPGGQDVGQRLYKRRIPRFQVYAKDSTGFLLARLFSGPVTRTSPALGTVMAQRRITAWNQDDDPTQEPPLREQAYFIRPLGRDHDPRVAVIKDTPGPLTILESDAQVSV